MSYGLDYSQQAYRELHLVSSGVSRDLVILVIKPDLGVEKLPGIIREGDQVCRLLIALSISMSETPSSPARQYNVLDNYHSGNFSPSALGMALSCRQEEWPFKRVIELAHRASTVREDLAGLEAHLKEGGYSNAESLSKYFKDLARAYWSVYLKFQWLP